MGGGEIGTKYGVLWAVACPGRSAVQAGTARMYEVHLLFREQEKRQGKEGQAASTATVEVDAEEGDGGGSFSGGCWRRQVRHDDGRNLAFREREMGGKGQKGGDEDTAKRGGVGFDSSSALCFAVSCGAQSFLLLLEKKNAGR